MNCFNCQQWVGIESMIEDLRYLSIFVGIKCSVDDNQMIEERVKKSRWDYLIFGLKFGKISRVSLLPVIHFDCHDLVL